MPRISAAALRANECAGQRAQESPRRDEDHVRNEIQLAVVHTGLIGRHDRRDTANSSSKQCVNEDTASGRSVWGDHGIVFPNVGDAVPSVSVLGVGGLATTSGSNRGDRKRTGDGINKN